MMGFMMRSHDWSTSSLGYPRQWPLPLKTIASVLLNANQPMFAVWGSQREMIYNDAYAEILGRHHPAALGRPFFDVWAEIREEIEPIMARGYAGEPTYMDDISLTVYRSGYPEEAHFAFFYAPLRDETGEVAGVFCGCRETTQQVYRERERGAELDRLRTLFDRSPSFVAVLSGPDHVFELANPSYLQLVGNRDLIGKPVRAAFPEFEGQGFFELLDKVYHTGEPFSAQAVPAELLQRSDASPKRHFLDLLLQPMRNAADVVDGILVNGTDVTAAWEANAARHESERRNRQILDSATDYAIIATDMDGLVVRWNEGARHILGWTEEEMLGQPAARFFTPENRANGRVQEEMRGALQCGFAKDERWHLRKSGERFWASGEMTPLRDEAGSVSGFVKVLRDRTEEHLAAQTLKANAEQLQRAQVAGGVGLFTLALGSNHLTATPEFCRIYGLSPTESVEVEILETLVVPEDRLLMSNATSRLAGDAPLKTQYRIRLPKTGEIRWIERAAEYQHDEDGKPIRLVGTAQDVTERHDAAEAIRLSEERFRTFAQTIPSHVWTAHPDGSLDWCNDQVHVYTRRNCEELQQSRWLDVVHPDDIALIQARWKHSLATLKPYEVDVRLRRHDGIYRWHLSRALPVRNKYGAVQWWIGTNTDTNDQHAAREILLRANATLEEQVDAHARQRDRIWNISQDLLLVVGADGYFHSVNPAWTTLLGFEPHELMGKHISDLIWPEDNETTLVALDKASHDVVSRFENRYRHKDGGFRWFSWSAAHDEQGVVYANGRHITDEKETREALAKTEEVLRQAQKMEAVGQFTGGIAHDFNNLLQGITGALEVLKLKNETGRYEENERFIAAAINSARRAANLTHRLLAFSRRQALDPKPVKANPLLASMEDLLRRTLSESIQLELVLAGGLWLTQCDPNQLENAILNLCINARDAMPDGGKLTIETCNAHIDHAYAARIGGIALGQFVCVCVSDTGTGMLKQTMDRAFEPFYTTKPIGQGTGLGLSMIYGFAKQSEGYAKIYSEFGKGTTVKLYLPRYQGALALDKTPLQAPPTAMPGGKETILVVEDEDVVRDLVVHVLHEHGYSVLEAADGPSGLAVLQSRTKVDLLVTDIGLPGLNGRQLADAARMKRPDLLVLFMTGYAENATFAHGFLEPGMEMITKPFAMNDLAERIRKIIEN